MLSKIVKTAKFMAGWLDWSLLYPLWQTPQGRQQIIRTAVAIIRRKPEKLAEVQQMIEKFMSEMLTQSLADIRKNPKPTAGPTIVTDVGGRHAPPKTAVEPPAADDGSPDPDVRRVPRRDGSRDVSELKRRLGLKKT